MARKRILALVVVVGLGLLLVVLRHQASADPCQAIVGEWMWFTRGQVTIKPDGTLVYESNLNDGTWKCTDPSRPLYTLHWRVGGYVNTLKLSPDGRQLVSTDPSQAYVGATRIGPPLEQEKPRPAEKTEPKPAEKAKPTQEVEREEKKRLVPKTAPQASSGAAWVLWKYDDEYKIASDTKVAASDTAVYFFFNDTLVALDGKTGESAWHKRFEGLGVDPPVVGNGVVYVSTITSVAAISERDHEPLWEASLQFGDGGISYPPTLANGRIFVTPGASFFTSPGDKAKGASGSVIAFDAKTGARQLSIDLGSVPETPAVVANGVVYLATADKIYEIHSSFDPSIRQRPEVLSDEIYSGPSGLAVADGIVYYVGRNGDMIARATRSLKFRWSLLGASAGGLPPVVANGILYVGFRDGHLLAFDTSSTKTKQRWYFDVGAKLGGSPVVEDGLLYVAGVDGVLHVLDARSGKEKWSFESGGRIDSTPAVVDHVAYFASGHTIFAVAEAR